MRHALSSIITPIFIISLSSCSFTQSETNKSINDFTDPSYIISKKVVEYALKNEIDSLYLLCDENSISEKGLLKEVVKEIQTLNNVYEYPVDNKIRMNKIKKTSLLGNDEISFIFKYPFESKSDNDDIRWIEVGIRNDMLISLYITIEQKQIVTRVF